MQTVRKSLKENISTSASCNVDHICSLCYILSHTDRTGNGIVPCGWNGGSLDLASCWMFYDNSHIYTLYLLCLSMCALYALKPLYPFLQSIGQQTIAERNVPMECSCDVVINAACTMDTEEFIPVDIRTHWLYKSSTCVCTVLSYVTESSEVNWMSYCTNDGLYYTRNKGLRNVRNVYH